MNSRNALILRGIGALAIAAALFLVLRGGDDDDDAPEQQIDTAVTEGRSGDATSSPSSSNKPAKKPPPSITVIEVVNGQPAEGLTELDFQSGDRVRFRVDSDVADEVHVHGYDISREVAAGGSVGFDFAADLEGIYEVELEKRGTPLAELSISPG